MLTFVPEERRPLARRLAARAWRTLGGYLRGSATLGVIEGIIIGTTVWIVGGALAVPVAVITFFAAFLPFAGAVLAGAVAVLVTLVTAGVTPAIIVLVVAVLVQQFDNDLLAPVVFGKNLELHPLVVLAVIVAGSTLFGAFGAVLAVPVTAVGLNVMAEWRAHNRENAEADAPGRPLTRRTCTTAGDQRRGRGGALTGGRDEVDAQGVVVALEHPHHAVGRGPPVGDEEVAPAGVLEQPETLVAVAQRTVLRRSGQGDLGDARPLEEEDCSLDTTTPGRRSTLPTNSSASRSPSTSA